MVRGADPTKRWLSAADSRSVPAAGSGDSINRKPQLLDQHHNPGDDDQEGDEADADVDLPPAGAAVAGVDFPAELSRPQEERPGERGCQETQRPGRGAQVSAVEVLPATLAQHRHLQCKSISM